MASYGSLLLSSLTVSEVVDKAAKSELQHDRCAKQLRMLVGNVQEVPK